MSDIKLLPSQSELVEQIVNVVKAKPSFVVLNGEEGSGKTFLSHYLAANGFSEGQHYKVVIFRSLPDSQVSDIRSCIIKGVFNTELFDKNDELSETARMFETDQKDFLIVIDAIDYYDQNFLNELYRFYLNYGFVLNLSVVITTSHLLVDLIRVKDAKTPPEVYELTISHLSPGEKITLLKTIISRKVVSENLRDISFEELADDCGSQPNQIVEFAENFVMNNFRGTDREGTGEVESFIPNHDGALHKMNKSIQGPKGPNKVLVIVVAIILTIALLGVITMLLKKQTANGPQEEVLVTTHTNVASSDQNNQNQSGEKIVETDMVNNMIKGTDDSGSVVTDGDNNGGEVFAGNILDEALNPVEDPAAKVKVEGTSGSAEIEVNAGADNTSIKVTDATEQISGGESSSDSSNLSEKVVANTEKNPAVEEKRKNEHQTEASSAGKTADSGNDKNQVAAKPTVQAKNDKTTVQPKNDKADKPSGREASSSKKTEHNAAATTAKVGEVRPFNEVNGSPKTSATGKYAVQVACSSNISDLQIKKKKLGDSAIIYERKNNALKYVLIVGYFSSQQEAHQAAKKIGGGAWVKSTDAIRNEKK